MSTLGDAVKAAAQAVFGSGIHGSGGNGGLPAQNFEAFGDASFARDLIDGMSIGDLYETQPHLRTVVSFVARNSAQLGRHVYKKDADDSRVRVKDSALAKLLAHPNDYQTGYDLFNMLFSELALYDFALWVPKLTPTGWQIDPIPGAWIVGTRKENAFQTEAYKIVPEGSNEWFWVNAKDAVVFRGYSPNGFKHGSSAVKSLKDTLAEQVSANEFRRQMWKRGGRVGMFMSRPKDAPAWSPEAKQKFIQNWRNNWSGNGANAGSTPLLEDGMELKRIGFTAKEEQWLEAATLSLSTVAGAYHVPPSMVGVANGSSSFASVREFRKMLYTETLGPAISQVEDTINTFLAPIVLEPEGNYLELNIQEKLQGDFEEQAEQLFKAVGGPYMLAAEARQRMNLPFIEGTDTLLAPLNMGAAGNNGPAADEPIDQEPAEDAETDAPGKAADASRKAVSAERRRSEAASATKAPVTPDENSVDDLASDLARLMKRQFEEVAGQITAGKAAWWNQKKWNRELSGLLQPHMTNITAGVARETAGAKGLDPAEYSVGRTTAFLKSVADSRADLINASTRDDLVKAAEAAEDDDALQAEVSRLSEVAQNSRAKEAAKTMATMLGAWAATEVARQLVPDKGPTKTWVSSGLPDSRHADMDGETVGLDEKFSNGADWPGDPVLGAGEVANCACGVDINYNDKE